MLDSKGNVYYNVFVKLNLIIVKKVKTLTIQNNILLYLHNKGIRQSFIAQKCGWSKQKLHFMLHKKQSMTVEEYGLICDVLNVSYDFFMHENEKTSQSLV